MECKVWGPIRLDILSENLDDLILEGDSSAARWKSMKAFLKQVAIETRSSEKIIKDLVNEATKLLEHNERLYEVIKVLADLANEEVQREISLTLNDVNCDIVVDTEEDANQDYSFRSFDGYDMPEGAVVRYPYDSSELPEGVAGNYVYDPSELPEGVACNYVYDPSELPDGVAGNYVYDPSELPEGVDGTASYDFTELVANAHGAPHRSSGASNIQNNHPSRNMASLLDISKDIDINARRVEREVTHEKVGEIRHIGNDADVCDRNKESVGAQTLSSIRESSKIGTEVSSMQTYSGIVSYDVDRKHDIEIEPASLREQDRDALDVSDKQGRLPLGLEDGISNV